MKTEKEIKLLKDLLAVVFKAANLDITLKDSDYGDEDAPCPAIEIYLPWTYLLCIFCEDRFSSPCEKISLYILEGSRIIYNYPHSPDSCEPVEIFVEENEYNMAKRVALFIVEQAVEGALENHSENLWMNDLSKEYWR